MPDYLATLERLLALPVTNLRPALGQAAQAVAADKADVLLLEPEIRTLVAVRTSDTPMDRSPPVEEP